MSAYANFTISVINKMADHFFFFFFPFHVFDQNFVDIPQK